MADRITSRVYVRVVAIEAAIVAALWLFGRAFR
jgi:hypothetical protein